jgi:hypothetical protein
MSVRPRRRRASLTLNQLKARMTARIEYATQLVEDPEADHELRLRGLMALVQAAATYAKLIELHELERHMCDLEQAMNGHGHPR